MANPTVYRIIVLGHDDHPKLGSLTCFDDVPPLSPVMFTLSDQGLESSDNAALGELLRKACSAIAENRAFSLAQVALNAFVSGDDQSRNKVA